VRNPLVCGLRNFGLAAVNVFPPARQRLMSSLSGLGREAAARVPDSLGM
jgi:hypothetical protein